MADIQAILTRKVGPAPVWVYGVIGVLGLAWYMRRSAGKTPTVDEDKSDALSRMEFPQGQQGMYPQDIYINVPIGNNPPPPVVRTPLPTPPVTTLPIPVGLPTRLPHDSDTLRLPIDIPFMPRPVTQQTSQTFVQGREKNIDKNLGFKKESGTYTAPKATVPKGRGKKKPDTTVVKAKAKKSSHSSGSGKPSAGRAITPMSRWMDL